MYEQAPLRLPELCRTEVQELRLKLELERESGRQTACLLLVPASKYAALCTQPDSVLHPEELKYFFSSHVSTSEGGECSSTAIRAIIKKLVAAEILSLLECVKAKKRLPVGPLCGKTRSSVTFIDFLCS